MEIQLVREKKAMKIYNRSNENFSVYWTVEAERVHQLHYLFELDSQKEVQLVKNPLQTQRIYFYLIGEKSYYILSERKVPLPHLNNFRDMGGYATENGKIVRPGLLYRSEDLFLLDSEEVTYLEQLPIRSIIDYRSTDERAKRPNQKISTAKYSITSPNSDVAQLASATLETDQDRVDGILKKVTSKDAPAYLKEAKTGMAEEMKRFVTDPKGIAAFRRLLDIVKYPENAPLVHHCRGGKDRTGYGAALILFVLGVPQETIIEDYMLTAKMNEERNRKRMLEYKQYTNNQDALAVLANAMSTQQSFIEASIEAMSDLGGNPLRYIQNYLNVSEEDIRRMRSYYLYDPFESERLAKLKALSRKR